MFAFILLVAFSIGLTIGSFLNVIIIRGIRSESLRGRSHCDSCKKQLTLRELIPVISFFIQKGRCQKCGAALLRQYPIVEFGTALAFALAVSYIFSVYELSFFAFGLWLLAALAISAGILILITDLRSKIIPDGAVITLFVIGIIAIFFRHTILFDSITAGAISLFFACFWFFSHGRWMGLGDAKLIFATSLIVGFPASLAAFLFSFWLGGLVGIILLTSGAKMLHSRIPFSPFILAGTVCAYFFSSLFFQYVNFF